MKLRDIKRRTKTRYVSMEGMAFIRDCTGNRCRTYVAGCTNCDGWRFFDEHKRFVYNFGELRAFMDKTEEEFVHIPTNPPSEFKPPVSLMRAVMG
jgi:hypothetical protein